MKKIDKITDVNPFKVPENYFDEMKRKIISRTVENQSKIEKPGLYLKLRPYIAVAASVAVFAILGYTGIKLFSPRNETLSLSIIPVEAYSETILNEIDILTLEEDVVRMGLPEVESQLDKKDIIDYLLLENIDVNEIQEQL